MRCAAHQHAFQVAQAAAAHHDHISAHLVHGSENLVCGIAVDDSNIDVANTLVGHCLARLLGDLVGNRLQNVGAHGKRESGFNAFNASNRIGDRFQPFRLVLNLLRQGIDINQLPQFINPHIAQQHMHDDKFGVILNGQVTGQDERLIGMIGTVDGNQDVLIM